MGAEHAYLDILGMVSNDSRDAGCARRMHRRYMQGLSRRPSREPKSPQAPGRSMAEHLPARKPGFVCGNLRFKLRLRAGSSSNPAVRSAELFAPKLSVSDTELASITNMKRGQRQVNRKRLKHPPTVARAAKPRPRLPVLVHTAREMPLVVGRLHGFCRKWHLVGSERARNPGDRAASGRAAILSRPSPASTGTPAGRPAPRFRTEHARRHPAAAHPCGR
ncbi:hypothetical protein BH09ACT4_BH09ACT4_13600 [soil metagenome]